MPKITSESTTIFENHVPSDNGQGQDTGRSVRAEPQGAAEWGAGPGARGGQRGERGRRAEAERMEAHGGTMCGIIGINKRE